MGKLGWPSVRLLSLISVRFLALHYSTYIYMEADRAVWYIHRNLLEGLHKRGFKLNFGIHDSGMGLLALGKAGRFYIGVLLIGVGRCSYWDLGHSHIVLQMPGEAS